MSNTKDPESWVQRLRPLWEFQKRLGILSDQSGAQQVLGERHGVFPDTGLHLRQLKTFFEGFDSRPGYFGKVNV